MVCRAYAFAAADAVLGAELRITAAYIGAALRLEDTEDGALDLMVRLRRAADSFVDQLVKGGAELRLEHTDALRGLVLEAGARRLGDLREVFRRLGGEEIVRNRNYNREYRREYDKVTSLEAAISRGGAADASTGDARAVQDDAANCAATRHGAANAGTPSARELAVHNGRLTDKETIS